MNSSGVPCSICGFLGQGVEVDGDYCVECWELIDSGEMDHPENPDFTPQTAKRGE